MQRQFLLSVFVFIHPSVVSALQNNLEFHLGCHTCSLSYFTLGGTVGWSVYDHVITKFSWMCSLPHFLTQEHPRRPRGR